ncbi:hypothetical protein THAOC_02619 [Thalassiosira oceanica]|uniref:Uncharacterized protein n=1 Tax=Thalassiosira oceanica TaxID=159749 RepID=K0TE27_THAOC|nr:hypothetical protein THAOC_02619 [Thalassiosira oceanica]|eukprot:EJK75655.1 hypothetical protein THAOC_02619 [Thalassiosira oceanica]
MNSVSSYLDCLKESFLNVAAKAGRLDEVSSLLALGTEVDYRQSDGDDTPLLASIRCDQKEAATLLLAYGAKSSLQDREGNNVIHLAAATGNVGFLDLFPTCNDFFEAKNCNGKTPADVAIHHGNSHFAETLKRLIDEAKCETDVADAQSVETEESADSATVTQAAPPDDLEDCDRSTSRKKFQELTQLVHSQTQDLYQVKYTLTEVMKDRDRLRNELCNHQIDESVLRTKTLAELNILEEKTKKALERITQAREMVVNKIDDERVCCICRENPKSCVLLTCRHMCVCSEVSTVISHEYIKSTHPTKYDFAPLSSDI